MKIAIYCNIGNQRGQDTADQCAQLRQLVLSKHREVYLFVDQDAGKSGTRTEFQKLFESAARREFQVVLVWALDRFVGETVLEAFGNIQKLLRCGVQFVSHSEAHFCTTSPAGELMLPIAMWIAQQERIRISERTKAGLATARRKGQRLGRPWKAIPHERVAADRQQGMSWRQLGEKYGAPQSTLRNGMRKRNEAGVAPPEHTSGPARGRPAEE
jgi:DNA invertase Pin-like site-specific DNA recombinase